MGTFNPTKENIAAIVKEVLELPDEDSEAEAWRHVQPLVGVLDTSVPAALSLADLLERGVFDRETGKTLAARLFEAHPENAKLLGELGAALEGLHDMRYLNGEPPEEELFVAVANRLSEIVDRVTGEDELLPALRGLATAARVLGRSWDDIAERAYLRVIELRPDKWSDRYNLGLFYKTRGRFAEGQAANEAAAECGGGDHNGVVWNLGICATGAGDAETALRVWKEMGQKIEMGRFGLPEGGYPSTKIRLAQRPLAERVPGEMPDDPGEEETIWIERLSPCHGIVRSALYYDEIGVDYGDVILFDGAPITYHKYGEDKIPVFPHLATLLRSKYQVYRFAGTQAHEEQISDLSGALPEDAVVYVHTEQFTQLCRGCWESQGVDHADHSRVDYRVVTGKVCAPPSIEPGALQVVLDRAAAEAGGVDLYVPELRRATGDIERANVEERRLKMIES